MNKCNLKYLNESYTIHEEKKDFFHLYKFYCNHENNDFYTLVYISNQVMVSNKIKSADFIKIAYDFAVNYISNNQFIENPEGYYEKQLWIKKSSDYDFNETNVEELVIPPVDL
jgi:hypothetical protein